MDSTPDPAIEDRSSDATEVDPLDELLALTRQLRGQVQRHIALGDWAAPGAPTARLPSTQPDVGFDESPPAALGRRTLAQVRSELGECTRCNLHTSRKSIVFGAGAEDAPLMFIGEAPGEHEDRRGEPFVGPAGELLDKMIEAMGWTRDSIYIANILMCRPPNNRNPQPDEIASCMPFLQQKIAVIAPRVIVALGRPSTNTLLGIDAPISTLRGRFHDRHGTKVMPTFHPAYLLREPDRKRDTWSDLKLVMAELSRLGIRPPNATR
ncbi:MAG: phage polymerase-related protein [Deltaproteobacteria bacterium]|nr:phage polymerase-related protein [Deltaproteobacteria bacterium]